MNATRAACPSLAAAALLLSLLSGCVPLPPQPDAVRPAPVPAPPPAAVVVAVAAPPAPPPPAPVHSPAPAPAPAAQPDPADVVARQFLAASERLRALNNADLVKEVVRLSEGPQSPMVTLEMGLGLGLTRNSGDLARAIGILDPLARSSSPDVVLWQPWARLLLARYVDQRRAEEQADRQVQQVRDQQRRIDQLNNQVEALKAIERSMSPRPAGPTSGAPAAPPPRQP